MELSMFRKVGIDMKKTHIIFSFLYSNIWLLLLSIVINLLSGYTRTLGATYLGGIVSALRRKQIILLYRLPLYGVLIMTSSYLLRWLAAVISRHLTAKLAFETRKKIITHLEKIPFYEYEKYGTGNLQSIIVNDVEYAANILYIILSRILNNVFLFVFSILYMLSVNCKITVVVLIIILTIGYINTYILKKIKNLRLETRKSLGDLSTILENTYSITDTIKTYNAQSYAKSIFDRHRNFYSKQMVQCEYVDATRLTIYNIVNNLVLYGSTIYLGYIGICGIISIDEAIIMIYLIKQIMLPIEVIFRWSSRVLSCLGAWERIEGVLRHNVDCTQDDLDVPIPDKLEFTDIAFSYEKKGNIFKNLSSFSLVKGKVYRLNGKSGAGKTTLLKLLMGLYKSNNTKINGKELSHLPIKCAYSSSDFELFPLTIYENITLGNEMISKEECNHLIDRLGFGAWISSLPNKIDTMIFENSTNLSGGQKQMIVNARALLSQCDFIILDEPFSALDFEHEKLLCDVLNDEKRNKIILITSHREPFYNLVDYEINVTS